MISAPEGRKSLSESFAPPGLRSKMTPPPGLRPGLHSVAAPRLNTGAIDGNPEVVAEVGARAAVLFIFVGSDAHPVPRQKNLGRCWSTQHRHHQQSNPHRKFISAPGGIYHFRKIY